MASFFKQLADDMERVAQVVEEGAKFMWGTSDDMGNDASVDPTSGGGDHMVHDEGGGDAAFDYLDGGIEGEYDMNAESPLMGMADSVLSDIMSAQTGPQTPKEHIQAFVAAITWNEPFIKILLAFHVLVMVIAVMVTRKGGVYSRMGLMVFVAIAVRAAEVLNEYGAGHWREFCTQNYFDKGGIFMGLMFCAPLLMVCLFMLLSMIRESSALLVDVKQMKMNAQANQQKRQKETKARRKKDEKKGKKKD